MTSTKSEFSWRKDVTLRRSSKHPGRLEAVCGKSVVSIPNSANDSLIDLLDDGYIPVIKITKFSIVPRLITEGPYGNIVVDEDWSHPQGEVKLSIKMLTAPELAELDAEQEHKHALEVMKQEKQPFEESYYDSYCYKRLLDELADNFGLTSQEREIVSLMGIGQPLQKIASELGLSLSAVNTRVRSFYKKLSIHSKDELCITLRNRRKMMVVNNRVLSSGEQARLF